MNKIGLAAARATAGGLFRRGDGAARAAAEAILAVLLIVQAGRIALTLWETPSLAEAAAPAGAPDAGVDRSILARFDPFSPPALEAAGGSPEQDAQPLRLFGIQLDGARSVAIIAAADGRQVAVGLGEPVEPGLVLESVSADHVVLRRGSHPVRLNFEASEPAPVPDAAGALVISPVQPPPPGVGGGRGPEPAAPGAETTTGAPRLRTLG